MVWTVGSRVRRWAAGWLACLVMLPLAAQATTVRLNTVLGPVDIELYDDAAPLTVVNFLGYVRSGAYDNTFLHRSVRGFVLQGGGFTWDEARNSYREVPAGPPVVNEYSPTRSNLRGTVAMAKLGNDPNSATTEWFVNLGDNAANLDNQNGGFTVFGKVTEAGMVVVDAIAGKQVVNAGGAFNTLPVLSLPPAGQTLTRGNLVMLDSATVLAPAGGASDSDRIFNYIQATYPQYAQPANAASSTGLGYYYRYYAATNAYIGTADGQVYYLVPAISPEVQRLGSVAEWLAVAAAAGY